MQCASNSSASSFGVSLASLQREDPQAIADSICSLICYKHSWHFLEPEIYKPSVSSASLANCSA